jgi:pilus assembly protein Flp/PilA
MELNVNESENQGSKEKGATMIEYALMIALIAIVCIVAITSIGKAGNEAFMKIGNALNQSNN